MVYDKPDSSDSFRVEVSIESEPVNNAEQAGLILYSDDDHYIKFVKELVDNQHVVVLAVEVGGKAAVHAKLPIDTDHIGLRLTIQEQMIHAAFREKGSFNWQQLEPIEVPALANWAPGLIAHGGDGSTVRWGKFSDLSIIAL